MNAIYQQKLDRLKNRVEVLESRNAALRDEVERLNLGNQPKWTEWQEYPVGVFGDGRMIGLPGNYRVFVNSRYQVAVYKQEDVQPGLSTVHLSIKRVDGAAIHDWRDFQRIKNELCGPECEGVELYPAESRLVDGANQYHLYVIDGAQWPVGFEERLVCEDSTDGVQQRRWSDEDRPTDLVSVTAEAMAHAAGLEE